MIDTKVLCSVVRCSCELIQTPIIILSSHLTLIEMSKIRFWNTKTITYVWVPLSPADPPAPIQYYDNIWTAPYSCGITALTTIPMLMFIQSIFDNCSHLLFTQQDLINYATMSNDIYNSRCNNVKAICYSIWIINIGYIYNSKDATMSTVFSTEMQKAADMPVLLFSAGANFWESNA